MEEKGFVKSRFGGITADRGGRRKKFYVITAIGKKNAGQAVCTQDGAVQTDSQDLV